MIIIILPGSSNVAACLKNGMIHQLPQLRETMLKLMGD